jgi:hypothetical protein
MFATIVVRLSTVSLILVAVAIISRVDARITAAQCSDGDCVQYNVLNNLCFYPGDTDIQPSRCRDLRLSAALDRHMTATCPFATSIAYYNYSTAMPLGDANWPVTSQPQQDVVLCMTGLLATQTFVSFCHNVTKDEEFISPHIASNEACHRLHPYGRNVLNDRCCGFPRTACPDAELEVGWMYLFSLMKEWVPNLCWLGIAVLSTTVVCGRMLWHTFRHESNAEDLTESEKLIGDI